MRAGSSKKGKTKRLPGPWKHVDRSLLDAYTLYYIKYLREHTDGPWDEQQLYYVAKAIALYRCMTGLPPEIHDMKYGVLLVGEGGQIHVLKKPIKYTGKFTRGYRYIRVDVPAGTYRIIKIRKKRVKKNEPGA